MTARTMVRAPIVIIRTDSPLPFSILKTSRVSRPSR